MRLEQIKKFREGVTSLLKEIIVTSGVQAVGRFVFAPTDSGATASDAPSRTLAMLALRAPAWLRAAFGGLRSFDRACPAVQIWKCRDEGRLHFKFITHAARRTRGELRASRTV